MDVTRREFLHAVTGAAVGSTLAGHDAFLQSAPLAPLPMAAGQSNAPCDGACLSLQSLIFPEPQEISGSDSDFVLDDKVPVVVPSNPSKEDLLLAGSLVNELSDRFGMHLKTERATKLAANKRAILMGSLENPLVKQHCAEMELMASVQGHGSEGYVLRTGSNTVLVAGNGDRGAFYGLQSLRQLLANEKN